MSIRIVTDSTADLPPELASEYEIEVVPVNVVFGDEELRDGVDITTERFFRRLEREDELPTTSQPSPGAFREMYQRLESEGATEILSIHVSLSLSGTIEAAIQGAAGLNVRVVHVDSRLVSLGLGMGAITAAEAARSGASLERTRAIVESQLRRTRIFFVLETIEYLRRGGRIGKAAGMIGSLLKVRPILAIEEGEIVPVGRARTRQKAVEDVLRRIADLRPIELAAAMHTTTPDECEFVADRLRGLAPDGQVVSGMLGPAIGVHTGPGTLGMAIVTSPSSGG